ncbi:hypothetical protein CHS0354_038431 [Potamilus streckersoni]|uniref:DUF4097 domain-containing protein n=1 Tax=Potamilus streckersoni TaxID=2493646 RepID=A0AAE0S6P3_9BIVA|nr:hypothetical protein CHS0354_038431 [Potamilus streckersoni]
MKCFHVFPIQITRFIALKNPRNTRVSKLGILICSKQLNRYCVRFMSTKSIFLEAKSRHTLLESWFYEVHTFGNLILKSSFDTSIEPLNPETHPNMNKLFIKLLYTGEPDGLDGSTFSALTKLYQLDIDIQNEKQLVAISGNHKIKANLPLLCHIQVPIKFGLNLTAEGEANIEVKDLESDSITAQVENGDFYCQKVRSGQLDIKTKGGNIISKSLMQGNLILQCEGNGMIRTDRLLGTFLSCTTDQGEIIIQSNYAEKSQFQTRGGNIRLHSCHGSTDVKIQHGSLIVDTLDGDLTTEIVKGNTNIYIAREGKLDLSCKTGDIILKLPESMNSSLTLLADSITSDDAVGLSTLEETKCNNQTLLIGELKSSSMKREQDILPDAVGRINVKTNEGNIHLEKYDWFASLQLGQLKEE